MSIQRSVLEYNAESDEAVLQICEGEITLTAFSCPFVDVPMGKSIMLHTLFAKNIYRTAIRRAPEKEDDHYFGHHIVAEVTSQKEGIVKLGSIYIQLDCPIPGDIQNGEYVEFSVDRLDY